MEAFGEKYSMKLKENKHLVADGLMFTHRHVNGTTENIPVTSSRCFFIGKLISYNTPRVAVNTCNGVVRGLFPFTKSTLCFKVITKYNHFPPILVCLLDAHGV